MTTEERHKAISTAVAEAAGNYYVPASVKVGLAAMAEELRELRRVAHAPFDFTGLVQRLESLERAVYGKSR